MKKNALKKRMCVIAMAGVLAAAAAVSYTALTASAGDTSSPSEAASDRSSSASSNDSSTTPPAPPTDENGNPVAPPDGANGGNGQGGPGGENNGGGPGTNSDADISWTGANTITSDTTESGKTYTSSTADENALLVTGGTSTLTGITVTKTGNSDGGDNSNFYGTNSGILVKDGATLTVKDSMITTEADGANGIFSYGGNGGNNGAAGDGTTVNIENTKITTTGNNAGGTMTTGGGTTNVTDCDITTSGTSSAAIRTDRGGGTVNVDGGTYTTNGQGSPAAYVTGTVTIKDATLTSNTSEGIVVEGSNSVTLENTTLNANNTKKNGLAETYQGIMLYQSMSGDAASGGDSFTATNSTITNSNGYVFYVTNQTSTINLTNTTITNQDSAGILLEAAEGPWGTSGSNGGKATMNASKETLTGIIEVADSSSSVTLNLKDGSTYTGYIRNTSGGKAYVSIEAGSTWKLTGDTILTGLNAPAGTIDTNGYTLTVNGETYDSTKDYTDSFDSGNSSSTTEDGTVYRFYNAWTGEHFFTSSAAEAATLTADYGWTNETSTKNSYKVLSADSATGTAIYRLRNTITGEHFFTASKEEYDAALAANCGWVAEGTNGVAFKASADGSEAGATVKVYRLHLPLNDAHFFTADAAEVEWLLNSGLGWELEGTDGVAFYGFE